MIVKTKVIVNKSTISKKATLNQCLPIHYSQSGPSHPLQGYHITSSLLAFPWLKLTYLFSKLWRLSNCFLPMLLGPHPAPMCCQLAQCLILGSHIPHLPMLGFICGQGHRYLSPNQWARFLKGIPLACWWLLPKCTEVCPHGSWPYPHSACPSRHCG